MSPFDKIKTFPIKLYANIASSTIHSVTRSQHFFLVPFLCLEIYCVLSPMLKIGSDPILKDYFATIQSVFRPILISYENVKEGFVHCLRESLCSSRKID